MSRGDLMKVNTCPLRDQPTALKMSQCLNEVLVCKNQKDRDAKSERINQSLMFRQMTMDDLIMFLVSQNGIRNYPEHQDTFNRLVQNLPGQELFKVLEDYVKIKG